MMPLTTTICITFAACFVLIFAQQPYTPDPYSTQPRNPDPYYNDQQRFNSQYPYNPDRDRYNSDRDRYNPDRNNPNPYNPQDRDRYNQDPNNPDRNNQDRYNQDRYNQDRYGNRAGQPPYNQPPYGQPPYNQPPYGQPPYGQGNYDGRGGSGVDDGYCCEDYCYRRQQNPYAQFATKTSYQIAARQRNVDQYSVPQCTPVHFWSLNKQGARLPDQMQISRLRNLENTRQQLVINYEQRQSYPNTGRLCEDDMDLFKRWHWNQSITEDRADTITPQGAEDFKFIARKYKSRFEQLLGAPYTDQYFKFQYRDTGRAHDSYQAYVEGLFPNNVYQVRAEVSPDDRLLKSYGRCNNYGSGGSYGNQGSYGSQSNYGSQGAYSGQGNYGTNNPGSYGGQSQGGNYNTYNQRGSNNQGGGSYGTYNSGSYGQNSPQYGDYNNPQTLAEYNRFKQRQEYRDLVRDVSRRLGFKYNLNETIVEDMYDMCRYEKAWFPQYPSTWCAAFNEKQLKLLEYSEDLKYFYKNGYGNEMQTNLGCPLLQDLLQRFENTVNDIGDNQKVVVYFADTTTLQRLLVSLGAAKDFTPLQADNYASQSRRQWRTSVLTPFSGNLVSVLFRCPQDIDRYKVAFYLNEAPLELPGCQVGLCNWSAFKDKVSINCNTEYCGSGTNGLNHSKMFIFSAILVLFLFKLA